MTKLQILQQATRITVGRKSLWLFGIFLASAFNLHTWYATQWLSETSLVGVIGDRLNSPNTLLMILCLIVAVAMAFIIVNFCKLMFLGLVHRSIHSTVEHVCPLCNQIKDIAIAKYLWQKKTIWLHTVGASMVTAAVTALVLGSFHFYSLHSEYSLLKSILMIVSVLTALVLVSWWNLLTVLFIFWHGQFLVKAAVLAADLISMKFRSIASITILATAVFLVSVAVAGTVLWQLPALLSNPPEYLLPLPALAAWQTVVAIAASVLFLFWLLLNNIWFNVVMILWFDQVVKAQKSSKPEENIKLAAPSLGVPLRQSIDRSQKIL